VAVGGRVCVEVGAGASVEVAVEVALADAVSVGVEVSVAVPVSVAADVSVGIDVLVEAASVAVASGVFTPGVAANGKKAKNVADIALWDWLP
jgi:hypothetical protein